MKPPFTTVDGPAHDLQPKVVGAGNTRRLVCTSRRCGEPIVGAVLGLAGWVGGIHESDFVAGRYVELQWPLA